MRRKSILVTGGAGFIGSNVVDSYIAAGYDVTVMDNLSTGNINFVNSKADFIKMDIKDKKVADLFKKKKFDIINHHAAQIDVRKSVEDPYYDASVNIMGSLNILENARIHKVEKFIFISSGGVMYGECITPPKEIDCSTPISPYGIGKYTIENYIEFYASIYSLPYTILRYGNVYGPRQNPKGEAGVVAIFCDRMSENEDVVIFGTGEQKRDYIYVKDVAMYNLLAINKGCNEIVNIGTGKSMSVNELYKLMSEFYVYKKNPIYKPKRKGELECSLLDVTKAKKLFSIEVKYDFSKGLKETIDYYKRKK